MQFIGVVTANMKPGKAAMFNMPGTPTNVEVKVPVGTLIAPIRLVSVAKVVHGYIFS